MDDTAAGDRVDPRAARTRERALAAGQRLLIAEGLDAVTQQRVAVEAGLGRRTPYRHWPDARSLLHDVLALTRAPEPPASADLEATIVAHLTAMDAALHDGPLAYILAALFERSVHDDTFESLRAELAAAGCAPLEAALTAGVASDALPSDLDLDAAVAMLEGPVLHTAIVRRRRSSPEQIRSVVTSVLVAPPRRGDSGGRRRQPRRRSG